MMKALGFYFYPSFLIPSNIPANISGHLNVASAPGDLNLLQVCRFDNLPRSAAPDRRRGVAPPDNDGGDEEAHFIDQPGVQKSARDASSAFDQHALDRALSEFTQHAL